MLRSTERESNKFIDFMKNNSAVLVAVFVTVFLTYGYEMSNFALTIDEEANWNSTGVNCFTSRISDGRFFLGFLKLFFPRVRTRLGFSSIKEDISDNGYFNE